MEPLSSDDCKVLAFIADPSSGQEMDAFDGEYGLRSVPTVTWDQVEKMPELDQEKIGDSIARLVRNDFIKAGKTHVGLIRFILGKRPVTHFFVTPAGLRCLDKQRY